MRCLLIAFVLTLAGCGTSIDDPVMEKRFANNRSVIVADEAGNRYVIQHHMGNVYRVQSVDALNSGINPRLPQAK